MAVKTCLFLFAFLGSYTDQTTRSDVWRQSNKARQKFLQVGERPELQYYCIQNAATRPESIQNACIRRKSIQNSHTAQKQANLTKACRMHAYGPKASRMHANGLEACRMYRYGPKAIRTKTFGPKASIKHAHRTHVRRTNKRYILYTSPPHK